jgi:hypothetical protein
MSQNDGFLFICSGSDFPRVAMSQFASVENSRIFSEDDEIQAVDNQIGNLHIGPSSQMTNADELKEAFFACYKQRPDEFHDFLGTSVVVLTPQFREVVGLVVPILFTLCVIHQQIGNGLNRLLTGVRGVGKSTLMKFLFLCVCHVLRDFATALYLDFERDCVLPTKKIEGMCHPTKNTVDADELARSLFRRKCPLVFFGDEIQSLYSPSPHQDDFGLIAVRELYAFGKNGCCFSMLSGSSATTAALAFKELERIGKDSLAYHRYPNLNSTVYRDYRLYPLRTREEVLNFAYLFTSSEPDEKRLSELFIYSGGVLRKMIAWLRSPEYPSDLEKKNLLSVLEEDQDLAFVFLTLLSQPKENIWELASILQPKDVSQSRMYEWIEQSWIYKLNQKIQLLFPWHVLYLKETRAEYNK